MSGLAQRCTNPGRLPVLFTNLIDVSAPYFHHSYCRFLPVVPKYVMHRAASAGWLWSVTGHCGLSVRNVLRCHPSGSWNLNWPQDFLKMPGPSSSVSECGLMVASSSVCLSVCLSVPPPVCPSACLSLLLSVPPPVCPSACLSFLLFSTRFRLGGFAWSLVLRTVTKICRGTPNLVTIGQQYRTLYMNS
jgi:putative component of membrane protein insertase Oxa1/YidC/SpoIIIJ protein YidD